VAVVRHVNGVRRKSGELLGWDWRNWLGTAAAAASIRARRVMLLVLLLVVLVR